MKKPERGREGDEAGQDAGESARGPVDTRVFDLATGAVEDAPPADRR